MYKYTNVFIRDVFSCFNHWLHSVGNHHSISLALCAAIQNPVFVWVKALAYMRSTDIFLLLFLIPAQHRAAYSSQRSIEIRFFEWLVAYRTFPYNTTKGFLLSCALFNRSTSFDD